MKKIIFLILFSLTLKAQESILISPTGNEALKFKPILGEKITLLDNGPGQKHGIGLSNVPSVQSRFNFYVPTSTDDFVFGHGINAAMTEKFRIKGNGVLEAKNRIKLFDAGSGESAGIWFKNVGNSADYAFLGMDPSNRLGIYSPLLGKNVFSADLTSGTIRIEGALGNPPVDMLSMGGSGHVRVDAPGTPGGRFSILENSNVGIGTPSPNTKLEVAGEITSSNANSFRSVFGNYGAFWRNDGPGSYFLLTNSGDQYGTFNNLRPITIDNANGNVAFGNQALFVHHDSHIIVNKSIYIDANNANTGDLNLALNFGGVGTGEGIVSKRTVGGNQYGLDFLTAGTSKLTIKNNGSVGIGITNPNSQLAVYEASFGGQMSFQSASSGTSITDGLYVGQGAGNSGFIYNYENAALIFGTNANTRMTLRADGNLEFQGSSKIVNENFQALSLQNSWVHNGGFAFPAFYKDKEGRVHLKGGITGGGTGINTIIATLPVGYRPIGNENLVFKVFSFPSAPDASIVIEGSTGQIRVYLGTMGNTLTTLDGISFRAE